MDKENNSEPLWKERYDTLTNQYFHLSEFMNDQTIEIGHLRKRIKDMEGALGTRSGEEISS